MLALLVLMQPYLSTSARSTFRSLTNTESAASSNLTAVDTLALLENSRAVLQQSVARSKSVTSTDTKNVTLVRDGKRTASLVTLLGADIAYICWAAFSLAANSFSLLTFMATSVLDGVVEIDIPYLTQFAAMVAGVQAEVADLMASIEGTVADAKGGLSVILSMKASGS